MTTLQGARPGGGRCGRGCGSPRQRSGAVVRVGRAGQPLRLARQQRSRTVGRGGHRRVEAKRRTTKRLTAAGDRALGGRESRSPAFMLPPARGRTTRRIDGGPNQHGVAPAGTTKGTAAECRRRVKTATQKRPGRAPLLSMGMTDRPPHPQRHRPCHRDRHRHYGQRKRGRPGGRLARRREHATRPPRVTHGRVRLSAARRRNRVRQGRPTPRYVGTRHHPGCSACRVAARAGSSAAIRLNRRLAPPSYWLCSAHVEEPLIARLDAPLDGIAGSQRWRYYLDSRSRLRTGCGASAAGVLCCMMMRQSSPTFV